MEFNQDELSERVSERLGRRPAVRGLARAILDAQGEEDPPPLAPMGVILCDKHEKVTHMCPEGETTYECDPGGGGAYDDPRCEAEIECPKESQAEAFECGEFSCQDDNDKFICEIDWFVCSGDFDCMGDGFDCEGEVVFECIPDFDCSGDDFTCKPKGGDCGDIPYEDAGDPGDFICSPFEQGDAGFSCDKFKCEAADEFVCLALYDGCGTTVTCNDPYGGGGEL